MIPTFRPSLHNGKASWGRLRRAFEDQGEILSAHVCLANVTMFTMLFYKETGGPQNFLWVAIEGKGAFRFPYDYIMPAYVEEKLHLLRGDADNITDLINEITWLGKHEQFGSYKPSLCEPT